MSVVTNIILSGSVGALRVVEHLNAWLAAHQPDTRSPTLVDVNSYAGGVRAFEHNLWIGAANYLDIPAFVAEYQTALKTAKIGKSTQFIQLLLCRQDDSQFREVPQEPNPDYIWDYRTFENDKMKKKGTSCP